MKNIEKIYRAVKTLRNLATVSCKIHFFSATPKRTTDVSNWHTYPQNLEK